MRMPERSMYDVSMRPGQPVNIPRELVEFRGIPQAPRNVQASAGSLRVRITWNAPADIRGIAGWRNAQGTESNIIFSSDDPNIRQADAPLAGDAKDMFYVWSVTRQNRPSTKIGVLANSNTDKLVVAGTGGATPGTSPPVPPQWGDEPGGGGNDERFFANY